MQQFSGKYQTTDFTDDTDNFADRSNAMLSVKSV